MPRLRRRLRIRRGDITPVMLMVPLLGESFPGRLHTDGRDLGELWEDYREPLLDLWADLRPGTRPWAWWEYDAPEPRRAVWGPGSHVLAVTLARGGDWRECCRHGKPHVFGGHDFDQSTGYETQFAYLDRLGLLRDGEGERGAAYDRWILARDSEDRDVGYLRSVYHRRRYGSGTDASHEREDRHERERLLREGRDPDSPGYPLPLDSAQDDLQALEKAHEAKREAEWCQDRDDLLDALAVLLGDTRAARRLRPPRGPAGADQ